PCSGLTIGAGDTVVLVVEATVTTAGAFSNTATVTAATFDPTTPNTSTDGDTAAASADLVVTKSLVPSGTYYQGSVVEFTIEVENTGPRAETGVTIADSSLSRSAPTSTVFPYTALSRSPCSGLTIVAGDTVVLVVEATVTTAGAFSNT